MQENYSTPVPHGKIQQRETVYYVTILYIGSLSLMANRAQVTQGQGKQHHNVAWLRTANWSQAVLLRPSTSINMFSFRPSKNILVSLTAHTEYPIKPTLKYLENILYPLNHHLTKCWKSEYFTLSWRHCGSLMSATIKWWPFPPPPPLFPVLTGSDPNRVKPMTYKMYTCRFLAGCLALLG